jgi:hypothetical protein
LICCFRNKERSCAEPFKLALELTGEECRIQGRQNALLHHGELYHKPFRSRRHDHSDAIFPPDFEAVENACDGIDLQFQVTERCRCAPRSGKCDCSRGAGCCGIE